MVRLLKPFIFAICIMVISSCGFNWMKGSLRPSDLQTITTTPLPTITLSFTMPQEVVVADCSAVSVTLSRPVAAEDLVATATASVDMSGVSTNGKFYSDSNCVNRMDSLNFTAAMEDLTFYYKANTAGTDLIIVAFGEDSYEYSIQVDKLGISLSSVAENVIVDQCSELRVAFSKAPENDFNLVPTTDNGAFYNDADCTHAITSIPVASGASDAVFFVKASMDQNINFSFAPSTVNYPSLTHELTVNPILTLGGTGSEAYSCVPLTIGLSRVAAEDVAVAFTIDDATVGHIYSDGVCEVTATSATIVKGDTSKVVYFMTSTPEARSIDAVTASNGSVYGYSMVAEQRNISATLPAAIQNQCVHGTLDLAVSAPVTFHVIPSVTDGAAGFYSDAGCTTSLTSITMAQGLPQAGFYVKPTADADVGLKFSPDNSAYPHITKTLTVNPHISASFADALVFDCVTVTTTLTRSVGQNIAVALGGDDGTHYSNSSCTSVITSATITSGATSVVTYYSSTLAGTHLLTFNAGAYGSDSKSIVMGQIPLTLNASASMYVSTCGQLEFKTTSGAAAREGIVGDIGITPSNGAFYSDSGCTVAITQITIPITQNSVFFYYKPTATTNVAVSVTPTSGNYTAPANKSITVAGTSGSLDLSFGVDGWVKFQPYCTTCFGTITDAIIQSDGKIIAVGEYTTANYSFTLIARFNANGTLDTSFGTTGLIPTHAQYGGSMRTNNLVVQPDGKYVVEEDSQSLGAYLYRYNADWTVDTTFGTNGVVHETGLSMPAAGTIVVQPDGKILMNDFKGFGVVRYNTNGTRDTSFGSGGRATTSVGTAESSAGIARQSDGKIVVAGTRLNGVWGFELVRYNTNGTLDTTFGTNGSTFTNMGYAEGYPYGIYIGSDDKITLSGYIVSSGSWIPALARYTANGVLDTSYGTGGKIINVNYGIMDFGGAHGMGAKYLPDGKYINVGSTTLNSKTVWAMTKRWPQ